MVPLPLASIYGLHWSYTKLVHVLLTSFLSYADQQLPTSLFMRNCVSYIKFYIQVIPSLHMRTNPLEIGTL